MNFKDLIDRAYSDLKLIPINGQDEIVDRILTEYFINGKKNIVLNADTGIGKSIIGAVVSKVFAYKFEDEYSPKELLPAMIVVHSNVLVKQYGDTFDAFPSEEFHQIIGASNYSCAAAAHELKIEKNKAFTGEDCIKYVGTEKQKQDRIKYCNVCEYNIAKSYINNTDTLITNYSYHFITKMWSKHVTPRKLTIFDEAHTINDVFCEHNTIYVSTERLTHYINECSNFDANMFKDSIQAFTKVKTSILNGKISEDNYLVVVHDLLTHYKMVSGIFKREAENSDIDQLMKLMKISKKYFDLGCKIGDLLNYKYDHIFELKDGEFTIKSIFVGDMSKLIMSEYNLFMSATISGTFMKQTMNLPTEDTVFIKLDPVYAPENKGVMFVGNNVLNYQSLQKKEVIDNLKANVIEIVNNAKEDELKGIMLTPSFKLGEQLAECIPKHTKVFLHSSGVKIAALIDEFKEYKGASILISPSIYEGVDFADDLCRYILMLKAPYPSLGDKRMKYIAENYPDVYKIITLKKIIQGFGRAVRNKNDYSFSFCFDKNIEILFKSQLNVWRNQFKVS